MPVLNAKNVRRHARPMKQNVRMAKRNVTSAGGAPTSARLTGALKYKRVDCQCKKISAGVYSLLHHYGG